jgi:hypothetical protein
VTRPRAADDFAVIRSRMMELERERALGARSRAGEPTTETQRHPISRNPVPIDEGDFPSGEPRRR